MRRYTALDIVTINFLTVVALVALLEVGASFFVDLPVNTFVTSDQLNHTFRPNSSTVHTEYSFLSEFSEPFTHVYNAQGWIESYDVDLVKPANTFRVFYIGDSFIEGPVPMDESVPSRVEAALNARAPEGMRMEVINTGTSSYSPIIYYVLLRYAILQYDPDLIVIAVDMSDDFDDWKYSGAALFDDDGNPYAVPPAQAETTDGPVLDTMSGYVRLTPLRRLQLELFQQSHLYTLLSTVVGRRTQASAPEQLVGNPEVLVPRWAWCQYEWDDFTTANATRTLDMLERTVSLARAEGLQVMVTGVPHYPQFTPPSGARTPFSTRPHEEIGRVTIAAGGSYLDSHDALRGIIDGTEQPAYYYPGDLHFNPRGFEVWANAHIAFLLDPANALLPEALYR